MFGGILLWDWNPSHLATLLVKDKGPLAACYTHWIYSNYLYRACSSISTPSAYAWLPFHLGELCSGSCINSYLHNSPLPSNKSPRGRLQATWGSIIYVFVFTDELPRWNELCSQSCLSKIGFYIPEGMCSRACFIGNINIGKAEIQFLLHPTGSWHWGIRCSG